MDAKGAIVTLEDGIEGYLRASEIQRDRVEDARTLLKEGDSIEAKFIGIDKKAKTISLSMKPKEDHPAHAEKEHTLSAKEYASQQSQSVASPTLGDIFKQQMEK